jgi:CHAT domain-containing protein
MSANINASGANGGGTVRIGGDVQGSGSVPNASRTFVSSDSAIQADALLNGNGGRIIIWADRLNGFSGKVSARGGSNSGNGGFVEVSSKEGLAFQGLVNVGATNGVDGTILLDPRNITIVATGADDNQLNANVPNSGDPAGAIFSGDGSDVDFTLSSSVLAAQTGNIILEATNNITIAPGISLNFATPGGSIAFRADADRNGVGSFSMDTTQSIATSGRAITISGASVTLGTIATLTTDSAGTSGGNLNITATNGNVSAVSLRSNSKPGTGTPGNGGNITVNASGRIDITGVIEADSQTPRNSSASAGNGGNVILNAGTGIAVENIDTRSQINGSGVSTGNAGDITLATTEGDITTSLLILPAIVDTLNKIGDAGNAGNVTINAPKGSIRVNTSYEGIDTHSRGGETSGNAGNAGAIALNAGGEISISGRVGINASSQSNSGNSGNGANVTLNAGSGNITVSGSQINTSSSSRSAGNLSLTGNVRLNRSDVTFDTSGRTASGNITFNNQLNGTAVGGQSLTLNSGSGTITLKGTGNSMPLGNLTTSGTGNVELAGDYTVANKVTFNNPVNLVGNTTLNVPKSVTFNNTLAVGANNLTLNANGINFAQTVSGTGNLILQPLTPNQAIAIGGSADSGSSTLDLLSAELATLQPGFNSITIGSASGSGTITLAGNATFNDPVTLRSPVGNGSINTTGFTLTGNNNATITLLANQGITTGDIINPGRDITLTSLLGNIDTNAGTLNSSSTRSNGGNITLTSNTGAITTGNLNSSAATNGGNITLTNNSGAITTGNLDSSAATDGGNITLKARTQITTGQINASGASGRGGNVILDPSDGIQVTSINAQGGTRGGTVDIATERFFRATDTFRAANGESVSISTIGGSRGGDITIRHGGSGVIPFDVGKATINGTAGTITSGEFTIAPTASFPFTYRQANIGIISVDRPTNLTSLPTTITSVFNQPTTVSTSPTTTTSPTRPSTLVDPTQPQEPLNQLPSIQNNFDSLQVDNSFSNDFVEALGLSETPPVSLPQAQKILSQIQSATGVKPALIYAVFVSSSVTPVPTSQANTGQRSSEIAQSSFLRSRTSRSDVSKASGQEDRLELILVTSQGRPIRHSVNATRAEVMQMARELRRTVSDRTNRSGFLVPAQKMYQWLAAPLEQDLQQQGIKNLVYIMDSGLRSIPLAALHDGKQFIVENYSVGLMPSLSLTDSRYVDVRKASVLAMGASQFTDQKSLPAVPVELSVITGQLWKGESYLNEAFTLSNLQSARQAVPHSIIHLATHAEYRLGNPRFSYIQLWNDKLQVDELRRLKLNKPPVELLVLSACRTAVGDDNLELGFAGIAVQAGVKSVLGSLWYVSDEGTLGLMAEFYEKLKQAPIKAEALRQTQVAMLKGEVRLEGGKLIASTGSFPLPPSVARLENKTLNHPYYWSSFTLIGNPW